MKNHLLSFGHGYSARAFAAKLNPDEWEVTGTSRAGGEDTIAWPESDISPLLETVSHVLVSIAPNEDGDIVLQHLAPQIAQIAPQLKWVGYLSTTGVYGDHNGGWVDEDTPLTPSTKRGEMRVKAEAQWQALAKQCDLPLHIFRLAGIYGPGRGPFSKVRAGTARRILKEGQVFSRIHVADIAQTLSASVNAPSAGAIYNLCDDDPAPPEDVIAYAANLLGLPIPPAENYETAEMTPMARSFYAESKRVRNDKIKKDLGVRLTYPTYKAGLKALLEAE
ncbi:MULTISPECIES: SDR family oxidoreductase [Halocynthiibacter]|uniref:SDR family oxidoreductase n=1 Tax=Halocynthiibacter halioticoli TaxID=2986804 RepID=A0AAE3LPA5_9RHOB|nr:MULTISPECIES: SDR family oxidoreductase [Halocynthiibacter]MCV6823137.1 SDR family oxidoreductase [Halocynthiibacter halioticoli]MCW4056138.1 SDR family oxidoreductase [Halocynthiibacter sp. SDUM655004]